MTMTALSQRPPFLAEFFNDFKAQHMAQALYWFLLMIVLSGGDMNVRLELMALVGLLAVMGPCTEAQSNDVYNFYFQKGSAPQQVIQGGGGQMAGQPQGAPLPAPTPQAPPAPLEPAAQPAPNSVYAKAADPEKKVHDYKPFDIYLGMTRWLDEVGAGNAYTVGAQVNFNRYLGVRGQGEFLETSSATYPGSQPFDMQDGSLKSGGQAAVVFTPLHLELLGHQMLKVSALGGFTTTRVFGDPVFNYSTGQTNYDVKRAVRPFWGAEAQFALNENVSLAGGFSMLDGGKVAKATADVVFSF